MEIGFGILIASNSIQSFANYLGVFFTSPLFMAVGSTINLPIYVFYHALAPEGSFFIISYLGMGLIGVSFVLAIVEAVVKSRASEKAVAINSADVEQAKAHLL